jgi:hypothetical protein
VLQNPFASSLLPIKLEGVNASSIRMGTSSKKRFPHFFYLIDIIRRSEEAKIK